MAGQINKLILTVFLTAIIFSGLVSFNSFHFGMAQAAQSVNSIISSDTTWTKAGSPYSLTGPVAINQGVTLTIEAGTTVNLNNYYIQVDGTLVSKGKITDQIQFKGGGQTGQIGQITFTSLSKSWNEQTGSGCIIENANFDFCEIGTNNTVKIANTVGANLVLTGGSSLITNNSNCVITVFGGSPAISNNYRVVGINIFAASPIVTNNTISNTNPTLPYGILLKGINSALISDNNISGSFSEACIKCGGDIYGLGQATIQRNLIINTDSVGAGIKVGNNSNYVIQNNTIAYSSCGIKVSNGELRLTIVYNNFQNNSKYGIYWGSTSNLTAAYNWWGTTNATEINQAIFWCQEPND